MKQGATNTNIAARADAGSMKETIESIVVAFILAFVFRAFVVEAFVIPTGSMAPTLLGKHVTFHCPMCGHRFRSDARDHGVHKGTGRQQPLLIQGLGNGTGRGALEIDCPMCDYDIRRPKLRTKPGDRILVLKYIYAITEPRRWDVVVFRNPEQPQINYIKRLVGLPNERIWIVRGNVYTQPLDRRTGEATGPWRIQSKPPEDQRAVWQPVYHSRFVPLDAEQRDWQTPWRPLAGQWHIAEHGRSFHYAPGDGGAVGRLRFDMDAASRFGRDHYPYNALRMRGEASQVNVEDLRLAATFDPATDGGSVAMELTSERRMVRAEIDAEGAARLRMKPADGGAWIDVAEGRAGGFARVGNGPHRVELWHVDQVASLWVDGRRVARFELPMVGDSGVAEAVRPLAVDLAALSRSGPPRSLPGASIEVAGAPMTLRAVNLDRDLYYTAIGAERGTESPLDLRERQFFVLGDNSPQSKDSRKLEAVDPWVRLHTAEGHGPGGVPTGVVPEKLMVGRAFFVYFPAPYALSPTMFPFVPNFGDMRFIE